MQLLGKVGWDFDNRKQALVFEKNVANVNDVLGLNKRYQRKYMLKT